MTTFDPVSVPLYVGIVKHINLYRMGDRSVSVPLYVGIVKGNIGLPCGVTMMFQFPCMWGLLIYTAAQIDAKFQVSVPLYVGIVKIDVRGYRLAVIVSVPLYVGIVKDNMIAQYAYTNGFSSPVCGDC